jgi:hypothetical protein
MTYDNTNRGTLGKNHRKEQPSHSDYTGSLNVDGVDYYLNGWIKEGPNGKFFSLSVKPKQPKQEPRRAPPKDKAFPPDRIGTGRNPPTWDDDLDDIGR